MLTLGCIQKQMSGLNNWAIEGNSIMKDFVFSSFKEALEFVNKVGEVADKQQHYPDMVLGDKSVRISLTTRFENGLTSKDFEVAAEIDKICL